MKLLLLVTIFASINNICEGKPVCNFNFPLNRPLKHDFKQFWSGSTSTSGNWWDALAPSPPFFLSGNNFVTIRFKPKNGGCFMVNTMCFKTMGIKKCSVKFICGRKNTGGTRNINNAVFWAKNKDYMVEEIVQWKTIWKKSTENFSPSTIVTFDGQYPLNQKYICPSDAIYLVAVTLRSTGTGWFSVNVMKNETSLVNMYFYGTMLLGASASSHLLVKCLANESIWLQALTQIEVYGETEKPHSTFTIIPVVLNDKNTVNNKFVGFTAVKSNNQGIMFNPETLSFEKVLLNEGNHFESTASIFTCPVDGVYFVAYTVNNVKFECNVLLKNSTTEMVILHSDSFRYNSLSNSGLVRCLSGEVLKINVSDVGGTYLGFDKSSFMALLVQKQGTVFIGFTAWKKSKQIYLVGNVIRFDGVMVNEGNHYRSSDSTFVCPENGLYFIAVTFMKDSFRNIQIDVKQDDTTILRSLETHGSSDWNSVSNSGIIQCFQGSEIKVVAFGSGGVNGDLIKPLTTFTVMKMVQTRQNNISTQIGDSE